MTLPTTGQLTAQQIAVEAQTPSTTADIGMDLIPLRALAAKPAVGTQISFQDFYGKAWGDSHNFVNQSEVVPAATAISNTIYVTGVTGSVLCNVTLAGAQSTRLYYRLNNGAWLNNGTVTVTNGDTLALKINTDDTSGRTIQMCNLTLNMAVTGAGISKPWVVKTRVTTNINVQFNPSTLSGFQLTMNVVSNSTLAAGVTTFFGSTPLSFQGNNASGWGAWWEFVMTYSNNLSAILFLPCYPEEVATLQSAINGLQYIMSPVTVTGVIMTKTVAAPACGRTIYIHALYTEQNATNPTSAWLDITWNYAAA